MPIPATPDCPNLPPSRTLTCGRETSRFYPDVEAAISQVLKEKPELFDFNDMASRTDWPKIANHEGYTQAMVQILKTKGYCARWDGEELAVKNRSEWNEQFAIVLSDIWIRRGEGIAGGRRGRSADPGSSVPEPAPDGTGHRAANGSGAGPRTNVPPRSGPRSRGHGWGRRGAIRRDGPKRGAVRRHLPGPGRGNTPAGKGDDGPDPHHPRAPAPPPADGRAARSCARERLARRRGPLVGDLHRGAEARGAAGLVEPEQMEFFEGFGDDLRVARRQARAAVEHEVDIGPGRRAQVAHHGDDFVHVRFAGVGEVRDRSRNGERAVAGGPGAVHLG